MYILPLRIGKVAAGKLQFLAIFVLVPKTGKERIVLVAYDMLMKNAEPSVINPIRCPINGIFGRRAGGSLLLDSALLLNTQRAIRAVNRIPVKARRGCEVNKLASSLSVLRSAIVAAEGVLLLQRLVVEDGREPKEQEPRCDVRSSCQILNRSAKTL